MGQIQNEFSWSKTRDGMFSSCPRRYWFHYYGSWGGWLSHAAPRTRDIYMLKKLSSRQMWAGAHVHDGIERTIKALGSASGDRAGAVDADEVVEGTLARMRQDFGGSREGRYRVRPKTCALFEHEYGVPVSDEEWRRVAARVERSLRTFLGSEVFTRILESDRRDWLECEEFSSFLFDGVKVHVKLDFVMRDGDAIRIYDWKTGSSLERDSIQLACYTLYAVDQWGAEPEAVEPVEYNLNLDEVVAHAMTEADLERSREYMRGSIAEMRRLLRSPDRNLAAEEDFPRIDEERACLRCNFFRVCGPHVNRKPSDCAPADDA